jgi:hypothetical protein
MQGESLKIMVRSTAHHSDFILAQRGSFCSYMSAYEMFCFRLKVESFTMALIFGIVFKLVTVWQ